MISKICKRVFITWILFCAFSCGAAQFSATVSSKQSNVGQAITLRLMLEDTQMRDAPDLRPLLKDFTVYSQQQYSSYSIINGRKSAEMGWEIVLLPKIAGKLTVPSISILTNNGTLKTTPIQIDVSAPKVKNAMDNSGISLSTSINKNNAYLKEPLLYTLKIISYRPWANIALDDIKSNDAIIEKIGDPKQYDTVLGGVRAHIIEIKYYITPLTLGKLKIAGPMVRGEVQVESIGTNTRFGMFDNMYEYKPFSLMGESITINVKKPPVPAANWLPLQDLVLTEEWEGLDNVHEGSTIVRKIKMVAKGGFSSQLPDLLKLHEAKDFKVYANKPQTTDQIDAKSDQLIGTKIEHLSLVPRKSGAITIPAVKVTWWNLRTNKMDTTTLPAKKINVQASALPEPVEVIDFAQQPQKPAYNYKLLYIIVAVFSLVVISLLAVIMYLLRPKITKPKTIKVPNDLSEMQGMILGYAQKHWGAPQYLSLNQIGTLLDSRGYTYNKEIFLQLFSALNAGLYAHKSLDLSVLVQQWHILQKSVVHSKNRQGTRVIDPIDLNPT